MKFSTAPLSRLRRYRNTRLYRPLARVLRVYNRRLIDELHRRGFDDFAPAFPLMLSNLDRAGTRVGVLAARAGVTRQAAGQLLVEIERCGYIERRPAPDDARAIVVRFTARGERLLANIITLVEEVESSFGQIVGAKDFDVLRTVLTRLADAVDPTGAFGEEDETPKPPRPERTRTR